MNMPAKQSALTVLIGVILFLAAGITPPALQAIEETNPLTVNNPSSLHNECPSVGGWMWTPGPMMPEIAHKVQHILHSEGIDAQVMARSFGETDPCGHFRPYEIDFSITINRPFTSLTSEQQTLSETIQAALANVAHHAVGNVQITFASHKSTVTVRYDDLLASTANQTSPSISNSNIPPHHHSSFSGGMQSLPYDIFLPIVARSFAPAEIIVRKVYVIVYDPILSNGQHLSD